MIPPFYQELHYSEYLQLTISTDRRKYDSAVSAQKMAGALGDSENRSMAPDSSMMPLTHAVYNEYRQGKDADKRMLLLFQFLEFHHAKEIHKKSEEASSKNMALHHLQKVSFFEINHSN